MYLGTDSPKLIFFVKHDLWDFSLINADTPICIIVLVFFVSFTKDSRSFGGIRVIFYQTL